MKSRRNFLKTAAVATVAATTLPAFASSMPAANIFVYSTKNPGRWKGKEASHAPVVTVKGTTFTVETKHMMTEPHYIVKHSIVTASGEVLAENVFFSHDTQALSTFEIQTKEKTLYALSFCNLHDLWVTEFTL